MCVHLSYCSMIYDDDHFRCCREQSHHEKYIFFPHCLFSSLSPPVLSVEICQSEKEWRMATTDCFKTLQSKSETKCTYVAQYLQLYLKRNADSFLHGNIWSYQTLNRHSVLSSHITQCMYFLFFLPPACIFSLIMPASTAAFNTFPCLLCFCFANAS